MAFDLVNEDNVYTCVGHPLESDIRDIVTWMPNEPFCAAYKRTMEVKTMKGLSLQDIITEIHTYVHRLDLPQEIRIHLLIKLGELEERLLKGTNEKIQLGSLVSVFQITRDLVQKDPRWTTKSILLVSTLLVHDYFTLVNNV